MTKYKLKKHEYGFFSVTPLPTSEELERHYQDTYYQNENAQYLSKYSDFDIEYTQLKAYVSQYIYSKFSNKDISSLADIGCGEGFFARYFFEKGWDVFLSDFSSFGCKQHNENLLPYFKQGDLYSILDELHCENKTFDFVNLANVLEHVINPTDFLKNIKNIMHKNSLLKIVVPNDYSSFQKALVDAKMMNQDHIFHPQEHLSHFTYESLECLLNSLGFNIHLKQAEFQTEMALVNENTNYAKKPNIGKSVHSARIFIEKFLVHNSGVDKYINYMEAQAELEFSRAVILYVTLK